MDHDPWHDPTTTDWWQREFTDGVDPEYTEQILPLIVEGLAGCERIVDVGTGEGQAARALIDAGPPGRTVIGIDPFRGQVTEAVRRAGGPTYALARADGLPFADGSFDAAVACLVFEHIDDVDAAIAEVARVLRPGATFLFLLNHPLLQTPGSGWIDDQMIDPPEQYWRIGPYLPEAVTVEEVQKDVFIRFVHRPLSALRQRPGRRRTADPPHGRAVTTGGLPRPVPLVRRGGHGAPPAGPALPPARTARGLIG